jgi:hypothetical protein
MHEIENISATVPATIVSRRYRFVGHVVMHGTGGRTIPSSVEWSGRLVHGAASYPVAAR